MPLKYRQLFDKEDKILLRRLIDTNARPERGAGSLSRYWKNITHQFNKETLNGKKRIEQLRNFYNNEKRRYHTFPEITPYGYYRRPAKQKRTEKRPKSRNLNIPIDLIDVEEIVCKNVRSLNSLSPSKKTSTSLSPYIGSTEPDYRSLADDLPKSWEYTEIGAGYLHNEQGSSNRDPEPDEQQHIFDDVIDFSLPRSTSDFGKNGMSQDLVNILADQARQHHKLKVKLLNEKFRKLTETHKTKMWMLESEHEMKRKQHEQKMENLILKYKKIKESLVE